MKIRVLHVVDFLGYGGTQMCVKNIVERLNYEWIENTICVLRKHAPNLPVNGRVITLNYPKYNPFVFLAIASFCKKHKIDIIHAHLQKSIVSSLLATFFCKSKVVIQERGKILTSDIFSIYSWLLRLLGSRATVVMANCQAGKNALMRKVGFPEESIKVVNSFIDFNYFDYRLYNRQEARSRLGISESQVVVGFVGMMFFWKGIDLLINSAALLCGKNNRYIFVIIGGGPQRKRLKRQVLRLGLKDKIIFTGLCSNVAEIMGAFDVAVIPSRREAFGTVTIEFMRMRVPVIASPVGGLPELVENEKTGVLLRELSSKAIAEAVDGLMRNDNLRESLVKNAEISSRKFDGREQLKQLEDLYKSIANK